MSVRFAIREDQDDIIKLLHLMHEEGGLLPLDVECAKKAFDIAFNRQGGIIGLIGERGKVEGAIGLRLANFWYTKETHIEEFFNFIHPDYRHSDHAKRLIDFAKDCAVQIGVPLFIGVLTNKRMAPKVRLYRMRLGTPAGAFFVYNSKWDFVQEPTKEDFWSSIEDRADRRQRERRDKTKQGQLI